MMKTLLKSLVLATVSSAACATAAFAEVRTERVTFTSGGETLVGTLYIPDGVTARQQAPGVVVTGAWMTIKEQMAGRYARELAERGIVALAFDFRTWGESSGNQRSMEDPAMKIADIQAAARFLDRRAETAPRQIGGLGICASAGYMVTAAQNSRVLRSVALVAPWLHDAAIVEQVYGGPSSVNSLITTAQEAQARFDANGALSLVPAAGPTGSNAVMAGVPYYTETDRGAIPQWENTFNLASWDDWLTFDAQKASSLSQPFFMVHSQAAAIPHGAEQFFANIRGHKGQLWLENVNQLDFYDRAEPVRAAADAVADHFKQTL
jgi:uncharacterized protein